MSEHIGHIGKNKDIITLGSPLGTCLDTYPNFKRIYNKVSNCGDKFYTLINITNGEVCHLPIFCDNKICTNPECQKHRLYKYMHKHFLQIDLIGRDIKRPKAWVFTVPRKKYPIDRDFCRDRYKLLMNLLNKEKHQQYGSRTNYSVHMEIKLNSKSWYLHFHVVSGFIENLKLVREKWGYVVRYEEAISQKDLAFYVSKYASKTPFFPNKRAFLEYANATYKLKMHGFGIKHKNPKKKSEWTIVDINGSSGGRPLFSEMENFIEKYVEDRNN